MQLAARLPERLFCHVVMPERPATEGDSVPEVTSADLKIYDPDGRLVGELTGYAVKRATRATLLAAVEGIDELLYEVVWRESGTPVGIVPADFLPLPSKVAADWPGFSEYLGAQGVDDARERPPLFDDLSSAGATISRSTRWTNSAGTGPRGRRSMPTRCGNA